MDETRFSGQRFFGAGLVVSVLLHAFAAVMLMGGVELDVPKPGQQPIDVELVTPPEPEAVEPLLEPKELELPEPEIPEPEISELEEPALPPEPAPTPEDQPQPEQELAELPPSVPALMPVVEFGDSDSGPQVDLDGDSSEAPDGPEQPGPEADASDDIEAEDTGIEGVEVDDPDVEDSAVEDTGLSETVQDEVAESPEQVEPETELESEVEEVGPEPELEPEPEAQTELAVETDEQPEDFGVVGPISTLTTPAPKPAVSRTPARQESDGQVEAMAQVRTLFSASILGGQRARTAMNGMTRSERVNLLCMTEMRAQLRSADPPRPPEFLPSFRLLTGTVLQPRQAAFRSAGRWYDLAFRCELNYGATRVVKFSYRVGAEVPRSQWQQRRFPSF